MPPVAPIVPQPQQGTSSQKEQLYANYPPKKSHVQNQNEDDEDIFSSDSPPAPLKAKVTVEKGANSNLFGSGDGARTGGIFDDSDDEVSSSF